MFTRTMYFAYLGRFVVESLSCMIGILGHDLRQPITGMTKQAYLDHLHVYGDTNSR